MTALRQLVHHLARLAIFMQHALPEPNIIINAVFFQICFERVNIDFQRVVDQRIPALLLRLVQIIAAMQGNEVLRMDADILAVVSVLRKFHRVLPLKLLNISRFQRLCKLLYLVTRVVNIKFTANIVACPVEHARQAVAQRAAPGVAHVHRPGGVRAYKLDHQLFALADVHAPVVFPLFVNHFQNLGQLRAVQLEINKAGAGNAGLAEKRPLRFQIRYDRLRNFARSQVRFLHHRGIRRKIAEFLFSRLLYHIV